MNIEALAAELAEDNRAYRAGNPRITDHEYDQKVEKLRKIYPAHPFLNQVEPEPEGVFSGEKVRHKTPMLSTKKAYSAEEIDTFIRSVLQAAQALGIPLDDVRFRATPKLDGLSGRYDGAGHLYTRGNGTEGQDISNALAKGLIIDGTGNPGDGEIVVDEQFFQEHLYGKTFNGRPLKHPRNFMVGFIGADTLGEHHRLAVAAQAARFVPYTEINQVTGDSLSLLENLEEISRTLRNDCAYRTDGIVIEAEDPQIKAFLGATDSYHRWQIAYKTKGETADVMVREVTWQVGRTGRITPVIELDPVELSGAVIQRVTAHNAATVKAKGIAPCTIIRLIRAGEVIPTMDTIIKPSGQVKIPDLCPCCSGPLQWEGENLICSAGVLCQDQVEGAMEHFCQTLEIEGFGPKIVEKLVAENGIRYFSDVFTLGLEECIALGISPGVAKNLAKAVDNRKKTPIDDWRVLAAFGIRNLGRGDAKNLLRHIRIDGLNGITTEFIRGIEGFGPITSGQIAGDLQSNQDEIHRVVRHLHIVHSMDDAGQKPLQGEKMVFTGTFQSADRKTLEKTAEDLGATVQSGVNAGTTLLVIGDKPGAKKTTAAESLGIQTMDEGTYLDWIKSVPLTSKPAIHKSAPESLF
ncbi:BRCT domain-containing protein [Acidithiobacillus sp.]|uniref:BRCT domain-containing protein n=1 Tax=Acidithiobacillus sp. TaxID=1872118 RepID=UPI0026095B19|nr:BRCT domain-containing protein [Acidithiobacillus sp.]MDD2748970.1 NAD-dependent DNA ligase [Acidithiobacillus sp.]MDD5280213.1 NAD-dependent DNA ligase [Acidithiobacillus sp.]